MGMPRLDLVGQRYGRLRILEMFSDPGKSRCAALCDCGVLKELSIQDFRQGKTRSCGCLNIDNQRAARLTHGLSQHPAYKRWKRMHARCYEPADKDYRYYGARGIGICRQWHVSNPKGLSNFVAWLSSQGLKPGLTVDRLNVNKGYSPKNCRLATASEQAVNRRPPRKRKYLPS